VDIKADVRQTQAYKIGYLRGAIRGAVEMLESGAVGEATRRLQETLKTIKGVSDDDSL
jgi:hypothetical protein